MMILFLMMSVQAKEYTYRNKLVIHAISYREAAKKCYLILNPKFTTMEHGLQSIDICINPVKGDVN